MRNHGRWTFSLIAVAAVIGLPLPTSAAAAAGVPAPGPILSPAAGTPDASPTTQISVFGVARSSIRSVHVVGLLSGTHAGRLRSYSGDQGASFVLTRPLTQGERVQVSVQLRNRRPIAYAFTVARLAPIPPTLNIPVTQPKKLDHFVTLPHLLAPHITIDHPNPKLAGDIFLTPLPGPTVHPESNNELTLNPVGPGGPMIIDGRGRLVWFDQITGPAVAANFRPQRFGGHEVLTWWQGTVTIDAFGQGDGVIADTRYRQLKTVRAGNGYSADIHEFVLSGRDAFFTAYTPVLIHAPGTPATKQTPLLDSLIQEVDVHTGLVVWEWHGLGHIPLSDSYATPATSSSYDAFHFNSIQTLPDHHVLASARDTSAIYDINQVGGRVVWTLGGTASSFHLGHGARFHFQHDAVIDGDRVSLFDDEAGPPFYAERSRGLVLRLNLQYRRATVVHQYHRPGSDILADSEGSTQVLPGGDAFLGFGSTQYFSQFSPSGRLIFDGHLPADDGSYRVMRFPWTATPRTRPTMVAKRTSNHHVLIYVSWNGATTVARWRVLAGPSANRVHTVATVPDRGFETRIALSTKATAFAVEALDHHGHILSTSSTPSVP